MVVRFFSLAQSYLSKLVAGFSICYLLFYIMEDTRTIINEWTGNKKNFFALGITTFYEIFSLFVVFGKMMSPIIINEASKRNLKINIPDIYWHYGELKLESKQTNQQKQEKNTKKKSSQTQNTNLYAYTGGVKSIKPRAGNPAQPPKDPTFGDDRDLKVDWRDTPAYKSIRHTAKYFYWINAVLFTAVYLLATFAGQVVIGFRWRQRYDSDPCINNKEGWTVPIIIIAALCIVATIVEIFGDWYIQRLIKNHNRKVS